MSATLNGRFVKIKANDFVQSDLLAYVQESSDLDQKILLALALPLIVANVTYSHAVISPRLAKDGIDTLLGKGLLGCAVTWVPVARFDLNKPFDVSWWRGGGAAITDVTLE